MRSTMGSATRGKDRLKQQLIRDLVQENLDVARGVPKYRSRRRGPKFAGGWVLGALIVAIAAFFSGSLGTTSAGGDRKARAAGATAIGSAAGLAGLPAVGEATLSP